MKMKKQLTATSDFIDDLCNAGRAYTPANIDQMMACLASLGVSRLDWIIDGRERQAALHSAPFGGSGNILQYTIKTAHALGIEVHAQYKPFESGPLSRCVPYAFPRPEGLLLYETRAGLGWDVDAFTAKNPRLRFKRYPGDWDPPGRIAAVKLVKDDDAPVSLKAEDLEIWVGSRNGQLRRYEGPARFREGIEHRDLQPRIIYFGGSPRRVLTWEGLEIDPADRFVFVRFSGAPGPRPFGNNIFELLEIYDGRGRRLPSSPAGPRHGDRYRRNPWGRRGSTDYDLARFPLRELIPYGRDPDAREFWSDQARVTEAWKDFYVFDHNHKRPLYRTMEEGGYAGLVRGKNEYQGSALNPIYPEVREYWLSLVRQYIAWGVDGVNFRIQNHSCPAEEPEYYGFNEPALEQCGGAVDRDLVQRLNGAAFTEFLTAAAAELKKHGRCVSVHLNAYIFGDDMAMTRGPRNDLWPPNFEWQWEKWIGEIADVVYLKNLQSLTDANADLAIDRFSRVAARFGKRVIYSGPSGCGLSSEAARESQRYEIDKALAHPRIDGCDLYEVASFTGMNSDGRVELRPGVADLLAAFRC